MSMITMLVLAAMLLAAISLFNGIVSMAHGGQEDQRDSHRLMFKRVAWQGAAVLFALLGALAALQ
jgi:hypothetical protein